MTMKKLIAASALSMLSAFSYANGIFENTDTDFGLQLLGTGGPISDDLRASSGELIWWKGKSKILIDAGGGVYLRFGQAGAKLEDLDFIGISHFHTDHSSDVPALLKGGVFFNRSKPMVVAGPKGSQDFPSLEDYMSANFDPKKGAYKYLSGLYDGTNAMFPVNMTSVDYTKKSATKVFEENGLTVWSQGVPHGGVPNLAYRIESSEGVIAVVTDNNGTDDSLIDFVKDADILVMPMALDENADAISKKLHMVPSDIARIAKAANAKKLVLNHMMGKSLKMMEFSIDIIKQTYKGPVVAGRDLSTFSIDS